MNLVCLEQKVGTMDKEQRGTFSVYDHRTLLAQSLSARSAEAWWKWTTPLATIATIFMIGSLAIGQSPKGSTEKYRFQVLYIPLSRIDEARLAALQVTMIRAFGERAANFAEPTKKQVTRYIEKNKEPLLDREGTSVQAIRKSFGTEVVSINRLNERIAWTVLERASREAFVQNLLTRINWEVRKAPSSHVAQVLQAMKKAQQGALLVSTDPDQGLLIHRDLPGFFALEAVGRALSHKDAHFDRELRNSLKSLRSAKMPAVGAVTLTKKRDAFFFVVVHETKNVTRSEERR